MCCGVDFTLENLLGTFDRQLSHRIAQLLLGTLDFLRGFGFGLRDDPRLLGFGVFLGMLDQPLRLLFSIGKTCLILRARHREFGFDALFCIGFGGLAFFGRGQAFSNRLLALLDGAEQRRPHKLDREPDENAERDRLRQQR